MDRLQRGRGKAPIHDDEYDALTRPSVRYDHFVMSGTEFLNRRFLGGRRKAGPTAMPAPSFFPPAAAVNPITGQEKLGSAPVFERYNPNGTKVHEGWLHRSTDTTWLRLGSVVISVTKTTMWYACPVSTWL